MKRWISVILAVMLILSLCACAPSNEEKTPEGLQVGYGVADITPKNSVGLTGYGDNDTRRSDGLVDKMYISCLAFTEGEETVLVYSMDLCACNETIVNFFATKLTATTGISSERVFYSATHNHSAPATDQADPDNAIWIANVFVPGAVQAAVDALADRAPASILSAQKSVEKMNFVRHYKMTDGTYAGANFGTFGKVPIEDYAAEVDDRMTLVKFDRDDEKGDILLVNWAAHVDQGNEVGRTNISAGYVGPLRDKLSKQTGAKVMFVTGASGNVNVDSMIPEDQHRLNFRQYGEKLADAAEAMLPDLKKLEGTGIKYTRYVFTAQIDHSWDHLAEVGKEIWELSSKSAAEANQRCKEYNMSGYFHARAIWKRASAPQTSTINMSALRVGGLGFINGHYEMFTESGRYIKDNSPFETTVLLTGNNSYIAADAAYEYRSYEADTGSYVRGTAEKLAEKFVELLNNVK